MNNRWTIQVPLAEVVPFINWTYFFHAWRVAGKFDGIEHLCSCQACEAAWLQRFDTDGRPKAEEALRLYRDAQEVLRSFAEEGRVHVRTRAQLFPARSDGEDIIVRHAEGETRLPMLRQQRPSADGYCYSLADFIAPKDDFIGVFACTVQGVEDTPGDPYRSLLAHTVADRLVEAASEWMHYRVRTTYWGYHAAEPMDAAEILRGHYPGIRPAVGYPSLPDQSLIFELDRLINLDDIGIRLTENGAMHPASSVCGLYIAHPRAHYFMMGRVDEEQLRSYAARRGMMPEEMRRWLP